MAETKTRASSGRRKASTPSARKAKATKARKSSTTKTSTRNGAGNGAPRAETARRAVEGTAKQAGHSVGEAGRSVGRAARRAKTPLIASGAAVAGAAGGIALGARQARHSKMNGLARRSRPKVKVNSRDIARAAKDVGEFGVQVGQLASELRRTREEAHGSRRRSPIEVVLQGLTTRGRPS